MVNGNTYVGSGHSLYKRISNYYQPGYYKREPDLLIIRAILKHGLNSFSLVVLEYTDLKTLIPREQYWMDTLEQAYNMIKTAGPLLRSEEQRFNRSLDRKGIRNSFYGKTNSEETKAIFRAAALNKNYHPITISVEITDLWTNKKEVFSSISKAAKGLGANNHTTLSSRRIRNTKSPYKGRYIIVFKGSKI